MFLFKPKTRVKAAAATTTPEQRKDARVLLLNALQSAGHEWRAVFSDLNGHAAGHKLRPITIQSIEKLCAENTLDLGASADALLDMVQLFVDQKAFSGETLWNHLHHRELLKSANTQNDDQSRPAV